MLTPRASLYLLTVAFFLSFAIPAFSNVPSDPKRILFFSSEDSRLPAGLAIEQAVRSTIDSSSFDQATYYNESQDHARIPNDKYEQEYVAFLKRKYEGIKIDLIFIRAASGVRFLLKHQSEIFTDTPKIFLTNDQREISDLDLGSNVTGVYGRLELKSTLNLILEQHPRTKRVVVITGSSSRDKLYLAEAKKDFSAYADRVAIAYLSEMPISGLQTAVSTLPSDNIVLFISYGRDPAGVGYSLPGAISLVIPSATVPVYAVGETAMGTGVVGGNMISFELIGKRGAEMGLRILSGETPAENPAQTVESVMMFDSRQLDRWNIGGAAIPPGSVVLYREPTAWERYKWELVGIALFTIFQTLLIGWLLLLRARRREAELKSLKFAALAQGEHQRLDGIVSNVPGIVWECLMDSTAGGFKAHFVSNYAEKMLGYRLEEWLSNPQFLQTIVLDEDREMVASRMQEIFDSGREGGVQFRWVAKDSSVFWGEAHLTAIVDENDKPVGLRGVTMDITESKRAEEALAESEERYRNVVEAQTDLICRYRPDSTLTFVNDAYCRYFGRSRDQLLGTKFLDLVPPHERETALTQISTIVESRGAVTYEHEVIRDDGTRGWQQWTDQPVAALEDDQIELQGIGRDITDKRLAEEALRISESRFRIMADSAPVLIWMCDPDKRLTYVNQGWLKFTGRSTEGQSVAGSIDGIHPDDMGRASSIFEDAFALRKPVKLEYRLRRADGIFRWLYDSGSPRFSSNGEFLGYIGSCVDISDRKEAEEAASRSHEEVIRLQKQLQEENIYLREVIKLEHNFDTIIGHSDPLKYVLFKIEQVAPTDATVLITGETGTGKELVARAIHDTSLRGSRPLVTVNCASLSASLIESELFGHERGAFTGAAARKIGRFELADAATLFLDEVGELPLELQAKLLRVIQEGEFERLGSSKTIKTDVRIIAATNRNLESEVRNGRFREDLLFRLNVFPITVPPLRERKDDIPELIEHFTSRFGKKLGKNIRSISPTTIRRLIDHQWPGNIRELANVVERSVINTKTETLQVTDIFATVKAENEFSADDTLEMIERKHIVQILELRNWKIEGVNGAALALGLNPSTLRTRMSKLGISKDRLPLHNALVEG